VQHHHDVETTLDGPAVAGFLVTAVAEVLRAAHHLHGQVLVDLLVTEPHQVGRVLAEVVTDQDLGDARHEVARDAVEHLRQRRSRVVRDDQNSDALHREGQG
jgi:hypothetical protein